MSDWPTEGMNPWVNHSSCTGTPSFQFHRWPLIPGFRFLTDRLALPLPPPSMVKCWLAWHPLSGSCLKVTADFKPLWLSLSTKAARSPHSRAQACPRPGSTQWCICWKCHSHHHKDHSKHSALVQVQILPILGTYTTGPPSPHPKFYTCIIMKILLRKFIYQHCLGSDLLTIWLRVWRRGTEHQAEEIKSFPASKLWFLLWGEP